MVNLTGKISKGTLMDQIYVPKERPIGFELGAPVVIRPLFGEEIKPVYYNVSKLEPIKVTLIQKILNELSGVDNIIVTGSFLEKGFRFNDIDIVLINDNNIDSKKLEQHFNKIFDLNFHIVALDYNTLLKGLETDPIYQAMLSRYVSKKRFIIRYKNKINYKLLDLHLLKSKPLIENFDFLTGNQKYGMARNMIAIFLFLNSKKISNKTIDGTIKKLLKEEPIKIKENMIISKSAFLQEYKRLYNKLFQKILEGIKNDP